MIIPAPNWVSETPVDLICSLASFNYAWTAAIYSLLAFSATSLSASFVNYPMLNFPEARAPPKVHAMMNAIMAIINVMIERTPKVVIPHSREHPQQQVSSSCF